MSNLAFNYKILPYASPSLEMKTSFPLQHADTDLLKAKKPLLANEDEKSLAEAEFEETIREIYYYKQSYFRDA